MEGWSLWEKEELVKSFATLFAPETRPELSAEENRLIKLCCKGPFFSGGRKESRDDEFAEQLDMLLTAAKARGKPLDFGITGTPRCTPLDMAAFSNGVGRFRVLLKHGKVGCGCSTAAVPDLCCCSYPPAECHSCETIPCHLIENTPASAAGADPNIVTNVPQETAGHIAAR